MNNLNNMKSVKIDEKVDYEIISSNERCIKCRFQCKTILEDTNRINITCKHPKDREALLIVFISSLLKMANGHIYFLSFYFSLL